MGILEGTPVSPGFAKGTSVVYDYEVKRKLTMPSGTIQNAEVRTEFDRIDSALEHFKKELQSIEQTASVDPRLAGAVALLSAHAAMAAEISECVKQKIGCEFVNVEQALGAVIGDWTSRLQNLDNEYIRQREQDIRDVGQRITRNLAGVMPRSDQPLPPGSVIVARELLPSEAVELAGSGVAAVVSEYGGINCHTAIIARSLGIPAVSGIPNVTIRIASGEKILVDGISGSVTIGPIESEERDFTARKSQYDQRISALTPAAHLPSRTMDGVDISLLGNVGLPIEMKQVLDHQLDGVGLFRTEFLFIESHERPSFETQLKLYGEMAEQLAGLPMVIRTFDLGGDKLPPFLALDESRDRSSLHLRGLRFSLSETHLLETQLRAIVQVAQTADIRILFPMVIGGHDFAQARAVVDRAVQQLDVLRRPAVGAMIETPAALFCLNEILEHADFVAIGTNDLTQYMLAADRDLAMGPDDCTAMHPAVLRAIKQVVQSCLRWNRPVCVCGEEAGEPDFARLLVGLGVRELSLGPSREASIRDAIRRIDSRNAAAVSEQALQCRSPAEVRELLASGLNESRSPVVLTQTLPDLSSGCL